VDDLYALFVEDLAAPVQVDAAPAAAPAATGTVVALPAGTSYHLPDCALVAGKADAATIDVRAVRARRLKPCRVCEPPALA